MAGSGRPAARGSTPSGCRLGPKTLKQDRQRDEVRGGGIGIGTGVAYTRKRLRLSVKAWGRQRKHAHHPAPLFYRPLESREAEVTRS